MTSATNRLREFWDQRYADADYAYGRASNEFLVSKLARIPSGGDVIQFVVRKSVQSMS